jgi:tRNA 2-selenouridine synthase
MAVQKISIQDFIANSNSGIIIDVRSPAEYEHAHIPSAHSLPLFNNEERAIVGTTYKQKSREQAIKIGLPMFGNKMESMIEEVEKWVHEFQKKEPSKTPNIYVHCWRGGMRSAAVAWLLDLYGFKVFQIEGGYKAFRNWALAQFEKNYTLHVLGGYTGSGKTEILQTLQKQALPIIDLEGLASHKGSAFGAIGQAAQPSQEMFENKLAMALFPLAQSPILIEDESQRIGTVMLPPSFFKLLRSSNCYFIKIPFESRLDFIVEGYGKFKAEDLMAATYRIQKRLGGLETKLAINHILEKDIKSAFRILLTYYDKWYEKNRTIIPIEAEKVDPVENAKLIKSCIKF